MSSGSRKYLKYTSDRGKTYALNLDESNSELTGMGFEDFTELDAQLEGLPKNIKPRYINVTNSATGATRKLVVGSGSADRFLTGGVLLLTLIANVTGASALLPFTITSAVGEVLRILNPADTGLVDDDDDD